LRQRSAGNEHQAQLRTDCDPRDGGL